MRAGGCALQQALTPDAANVVKQSVVLAKRRGHAQVTPLHVANTMLAASAAAGAGLFRAACLESHSHPLQCKALELCFNVALNRLPSASSPSPPMLGQHSHHHSHPSISNALIAAFKRAQAHQRRGSVENQQQPILAVKIELEQLIISILDDPSVSRVMREAGFSSTQVKRNVEKAVSLELCSSQKLSSSPPSSSPLTIQNASEEVLPVRNEDVNIVIENLLTRSRKRKSLVLVGESITNLESTVKGLMDRVEKERVPDSFREVKFITIPPLYSFCNLRKEDVEQKIGELTCLVKSLVGKGVVLYLGDLKWISEYRVGLEQERGGYYCSVEHMIMEIGRLVWGFGEVDERFWVMGIATFQTYMRCRGTNNGCYNSLETVWGLNPVTIPANSLGFSLVSESDEQIEANGGAEVLSCCADCSQKFKAEERKLGLCDNNEPALSIGLPFWLKDESRRNSKDNQNCEAVKELRKKWNSFCSLAHKHPTSLQQTLTLFSSSPTPEDNNQQWTSSNLVQHVHENIAELRSPFCSNPNSSTPNSASSSDIMDMEYSQKFKEFNAENLNLLCNALEKNLPMLREITPEIAGTVLQCRSGMLRRKHQTSGCTTNDVKQETWLLFIGPDGEQTKEKISRELAKVVFGSYSGFVSIRSNVERFAEAVSENPHRVFFVEGLEQADYSSKTGIKMAIERGRIISSRNGEEVGLRDAIIVLSCERSIITRSRDSLDLNISFDDETVDDQPVADDLLGILEIVDRRVVFKEFLTVGFS